MAGMEVDLALNVRRFQAGTQDAAMALEDVVDVMAEIADEGRDVETKAAGAVEELGDEARDTEGRLRDVVRELQDVGDAGRRAGDDIDDGMRRAGDGLDDFKSEASSSGREAAASFSGEFDDVTDFIQEVAANAFEGFGPAGMVAGAAAAVGIGLVTAAIGASNEAAEEGRDRAAEWAQAYIDAGTTVLGAATQAQMAQDIITDPERWQEAQDNAREWGVSTAVAVAAMTGETWALEAANASLTEREQEAAAAAVGLADGGEALAEVLGGATSEVRNGREALDALNTAMQNGEIGASTYSETLLLMAQNTAGSTTAVNEFGDSIISLPDGAQIIVDAETGQASMDIENVHFATNQLDGQSATVTATAQTGNAETTLNYLVRNREARIRVQLQSRLGAAIEV